MTKLIQWSYNTFLEYGFWIRHLSNKQSFWLLIHQDPTKIRFMTNACRNDRDYFARDLSVAHSFEVTFLGWLIMGGEGEHLALCARCSPSPPILTQQELSFRPRHFALAQCCREKSHRNFHLHIEFKLFWIRLIVKTRGVGRVSAFDEKPACKKHAGRLRHYETMTNIS